ncbi:MAG: hypothetical protein L0H15_10155 [Nitrosospira sp.]|nr:hypothetical protein [Nitrosospira sp.]
MIHDKVEKMVIVVHGTYALEQTWWRWPSPFTEYLDTLTAASLPVGDGSVYKGTDFFQWSAENYDSRRRSAALDLAAWIRDHPADHLTIVAHSHGGNVSMLATRHGVKIERLILLGSPIRTDYTPDLRNVGILYNIYSFGDLIQTVGTKPHQRGEGRSLGDSEKVVNFLARNGFLGPGHSDLHDVNVWKANDFNELISYPDVS